MRNLPIEVDDLAVQVKEGKGAPRSRPVKDTERRCELFDTMW